MSDFKDFKNEELKEVPVENNRASNARGDFPPCFFDPTCYAWCLGPDYICLHHENCCHQDKREGQHPDF